MTTRIGFLRAVNVGSRRVPMARLVDVCEHLGFADVWTYANSGNVVFDAAGARQRIEHDIERALESEFGFEVTTFVRSARELAHAVELQPFEVSGNDTYFVTFFKSPLAATKASRPTRR